MNAAQICTVERAALTALTREAEALEQVGTDALTLAMQRLQAAGEGAVVRLQAARLLMQSIETPVAQELAGFLADMQAPENQPALPAPEEHMIDLAAEMPAPDDDTPPAPKPGDRQIDLAEVPTPAAPKRRTRKAS